MNKVILINGSAGIGKTTISKKYLEDNPLTLSIEGDQIIGMMGAWRDSEEQARKIVFEHAKEMLKTHLKSNYDVLLPYLLTDHTHAEEFRRIAESNDATYYEILLHADKKVAVERLLKRGVWGEEGSEILTEDHRDEIEKLYDTVMTEIEKRPSTIRIEAHNGQIEKTYSKFVEAISD